MQRNKNKILIYQDDNGITNLQRNIAHYNLDVIIALGYRVQSQVATRFRRWATQTTPSLPSPSTYISKKTL